MFLESFYFKRESFCDDYTLFQNTNSSMIDGLEEIYDMLQFL